MSHPLVDQLRFTRAEFIRGVKRVSDEDGRRRFLPMNCLAWREPGHPPIAGARAAAGIRRRH
jgi:hypothetical protein